jgi:hypothetical protein
MEARWSGRGVNVHPPEHGLRLRFGSLTGLFVTRFAIGDRSRGIPTSCVLR